jgi:hypothetical protein
MEMVTKYTEDLTGHFRTKFSRLKGFWTKRSLCFFTEKKDKLLMLLFLAFVVTAKVDAQNATVQTDKLDYMPGEYVIVTGSGWQPNENVELLFEEYPVVHAPEIISVTADGSGNIYNGDYLIEPHDLGQSFTLTATGLSSGKIAKTYFTDGPPLDLDQGHNGGIGATPVSPIDWVNGNAHSGNSHFLEGQSIPYRFVLKDVTVGTHTVTIGWDIRDGGKSAIDYITHYQRISETVDPLDGLTGTFGDANLFPIPAPTATVMVNAYSGNQPQPLYSFNQLPASERLMTIYNGNITSMVYNPEGNPTLAHSETRLRIIFTVTGSTKDVVFCWGGHIASRLDWGAANASSDISGSPYHTRVVDFDGSGGSQDRSLKTNAVLFVPSCNVTGPALVCPGSIASFTAITNAPTPTFTWAVSGGTISGSNTGSVVSVIAPASGAFSVNVTIVDMSGGVASATSICGMGSTVTAAPSANAGPDQNKCYEGANTSFTLAGSSSNGTATWSVMAGSAVIADPSSLTSSVTVSSASATLQLITSSSNTNCANANDEVVLAVNPLPTVSCGPGGNLTCSATTLALGGSASAGASVVWSGPGIVSGGSSVNPIVNQPGVYKMVATFSATGCQDSCSVNITQDIAGPGLSCGAGGTLTCEVTTLTLSATTGTGVAVVWSGPGIVSGGTTLNPVINQPGQYKIVATKTSSGCKDSCVVTIAQDVSGPGLSCGSGGTLTCGATSMTLSATTGTGVTVAWTGPGIVSGGTTLNPVINQPGEYKIVATKTSSGCKDSCFVNIDQDINGPQLSCGSGGTLTCAVTSLTLSASTGTDVSVVWSGPGIVSGGTTLNPVINQPGDYKIVATENSSGCEDSCVVTIGLDISGSDLSCGIGGTLTCEVTTLTLSASANPSSTAVWSGPGIVSGGTTLNPVINQPGEYKVVVTKTSSGCKDSCVVNVSQDVAGPDLRCGGNGTLTCSTTTLALSASTGTGVSVVWSGPGIVSGGTSLNPIINMAGSYKVVATKNSSLCKDSCVVTVVSNTLAPSCTIAPPDALPVCGSKDNELTALTENAVSYVWSVIGEGWEITDGQGTASIKYTAGSGDTATFKLVLTGANGCMDSCMVSFGTAVCMKLEPYCSLTQGFYGNAKGIACATGERGYVLINRLLGAPFGNLVIGKPGRSLTITQETAICITLRLPAGGTANRLPVGDQVFGTNCSTLIELNKQGRFNNVLLGQTIALGLNMRLDADLASLEIKGTEMTTIGTKPGPDGKCGTEDDIPNMESVITKTIPQTVIDALKSIYGDATVKNLFDLANKALGGQSTGSAKLSEINEAVSAINEGFDGCRFLQGWDIFRAKLAGETTSKLNTSEIAMKAYPNPFEYSTTIEFSTKTAGTVAVSVYSIDGKRVAALYNGEVKANETHKVVFNGENLPSGVYFYKITMGNVVYFDKLVLSK